VTRRLRVGRCVGYLALIGAPLPWAGTCLAGEPTIGSSPQGTEVMLYISQPFGPFAAARSYGLRVDQHSTPSALPGGTSSAAELSGRRELVNLRLAQHEDLRIDFGHRVSWDFSTRQLNLPSDLPVMQTGFPKRMPGAISALAARAVSARSATAPIAAALALPLTPPLTATPLLRAVLP